MRGTFSRCEIALCAPLEEDCRRFLLFFRNFVIKLLNVDLWGLKQSCHTVFCVASQTLMRCVHRGCRMLDFSQVSCRLIRDVLRHKNKKQILYF